MESKIIFGVVVFLLIFGFVCFYLGYSGGRSSQIRENTTITQDLANCLIGKLDCEHIKGKYNCGETNNLGSSEN